MRAPGIPCAPVGRLGCEGEGRFWVCAEGGRVSMGSVARGTRCVGGAIVAERG